MNTIAGVVSIGVQMFGAYICLRSGSYTKVFDGITVWGLGATLIAAGDIALVYFVLAANGCL